MDNDKYRNEIIEINEQFSDCCEMRDLLAKVIFAKTRNKKNFLKEVLDSIYVTNGEKQNILLFAHTQNFISSSELKRSCGLQIEYN